MNSWTLWLCAQPHGRQWGASKLAYPPHATGLPLDPHKASSHTCTHTRFHHGGAPQGSSTLGFPTRLRLTKQKNSQRHGFPNRGSAYKRFCHIVPTHELPHKGLWHTIPLQNFPQTDFPPKKALPPEVTDQNRALAPSHRSHTNGCPQGLPEYPPLNSPRSPCAFSLKKGPPTKKSLT